MDNKKAIEYIENSFLKDLINNEEITDISFNGKDIFYVSNIYGRKKSDITITNSEAKDFVRQISNLCEKQFSFSSPTLNVTFGKYRLNAVHQSIGKLDNDEAITFSLRIASLAPKINDDSLFLNKKLVSLFEILIRSKTSLLISGTTGSGKTEFQKYLLRKIKDNARVIIIDNISELEVARDNNDVDLTFWCSDDRNGNTSISSLIQNALRCNPDWLIVAEARGGEMEDVLNSALTGIPIISTLHSFDLFSIPDRVISMVMMNDKRSNRSEIFEELKYHIRFYVFLEKEYGEDHKIFRRIKSIGELDEKGKMHLIYEFNNNKETYGNISQNNANLLDFNDNDSLFIKTFIGEKS